MTFELVSERQNSCLHLGKKKVWSRKSKCKAPGVLSWCAGGKDKKAACWTMNPEQDDEMRSGLCRIQSTGIFIKHAKEFRFFSEK